MQTSGIMSIVRKVRPTTRKWLVKKGYLERVTEDKVRVWRITDSGHQYFANVFKKS